MYASQQRVRLYTGAADATDEATGFGSVGYAYAGTRWGTVADVAGSEVTVAGQAQQDVDVVLTLDDDGRPLADQVDVTGAFRDESGRFFRVTNAARHPLLRAIVATGVSADAAGATVDEGTTLAAVVLLTPAAGATLAQGATLTATAEGQTIAGEALPGVAFTYAATAGDGAAATINPTTGLISPLAAGGAFTFTATGSLDGVTRTSAPRTVSVTADVVVDPNAYDPTADLLVAATPTLAWDAL